MNKQFFRSCQEPIRIGLSFEERWRGPDKGLITCWEVGRDMSKKEPELAERARRGELPVIGWKGGVDKKIKKKGKYGTYNYLALWQGLRGVDLNIDLTEEVEIVCSRTGMKVVYTDDATKYAEP
jgi:hypothetical protein